MSDTPSTPTPQAPPLGFWQRFRFLGPSLILTATLVGSGELIITTLFGAQVGFTALWLIVLACLLKVAVQETLGRYTISSGLTSLRIMDQLPGPRMYGGWAVWFWLVVVLLGSTQLGGVATAVGDALHIVWPSTPTSYWSIIVCAIALFILIGGRYVVIERVSVTLVSIFSVSIIFCGIILQWTDYGITWSNIVEGFQFTVDVKHGHQSAWVLGMAIIGAVGLSSTELVYYPYWCVEKGYARFTGPNEPTPEWEQRAKGWIRVMQLDCYFAFVIYTTTTIAFYFLGAAVLSKSGGGMPKKDQLIETLSSMYTETLGPWAYYVFIICSILVLFSTLFVSIASYGRLFPDCLGILGAIKFDTDDERRRWTRNFVIVFAIVFAAASQLPGKVEILIALGLIPVTLMLPVICFTALYVRFKKLDPRLRPSRLLDFWLLASCILIVTLTIYGLGKNVGQLGDYWDQVQSYFSGQDQAPKAPTSE